MALTAITIPGDVAEFIREARDGLGAPGYESGTDHPNALEVGKRLADILKSEGFSRREIRTFAARYTLALEGFAEEAHENIGVIVDDFMCGIDFKLYWDNNSSIFTFPTSDDI